MHPVVVGITGASGAILGVRLLEALKSANVETHLVMSRWAERTLVEETGYTPEQVKALASVCHDADDMAAAVSSGSFLTSGMVICPCSMKSLAAIACGFSYNLVARAADVTLKEGRKLVLVPRETPFSPIHLENMLKLSRLGVTILPPCVGFYTRPETVEDVVRHTVGKILDALGLEQELFGRWEGPRV